MVIQRYTKKEENNILHCMVLKNFLILKKGQQEQRLQ